MSIDYFPASPDAPLSGQSRHVISGLSSALPATATAGQLIYETDTGSFKYWTGTAWKYVNQTLGNFDRLTIADAVSQADGVAIGGANAALWIDERDAASTWALYASSTKFRINGGGTDFYFIERAATTHRHRFTGNVSINDTGAPASAAGDWNLIVNGNVGDTYAQFFLKKQSGAFSVTNAAVYFRLQANRTWWIREWDGTTDREWLAFDWPNSLIYVPHTIRSAATTPLQLNPIPDAWLQSNGCLRGAYGGAGGCLKTRSGGNDFSVQWGGPLDFYVDVTHVKTFVIDHPTDSERHLVHACTEGPEATVFYRGQAQLEGGWVRVDLPDYFEALCAVEGRSVQLTCIADDPEDEWCPVLHATYPKDGAFYVGLGSGVVVPDQRFWWEVKAVRKDVPALRVEPLRTEIEVAGEGPYRYYREAS